MTANGSHDLQFSFKMTVAAASSVSAAFDRSFKGSSTRTIPIIEDIETVVVFFIFVYDWFIQYGMATGVISERSSFVEVVRCEGAGCTVGVQGVLSRVFFVYLVVLCLYPAARLGEGKL